MSSCPFCEQPLSIETQPESHVPLLVTVNLKQGLPTAREACGRLRRHIDTERKRGVRVLKVIHGYGSSGKGGRIREEVRKLLAQLEAAGAVAGFLTGEEFRRSTGEARHLVGRFPDLKTDSDFGRGNPGVTLVILS